MNLIKLHIHTGLKALKESYFLKSVFSAGISSGLRLFNGLLLIKAIAIISGPAGMPIAGNFINVTQIAQIFATAGISMGIIKYLSQHKKGSEAYNKYLSGAFFLTLIFSCLAAFLLILFSPLLSFFFFQTKIYFYYFIFLALSSIFFGLNNFLSSYFNGIQNHRTYIYLNLINGLFGLVLLLCTIYLKNWHLIFISIIFYQTGGFLFIGLKKVFQIYKNEIEGKPIQIITQAKGFASYAIYALQNVIVIGVSQLLIRSFLIQKESVQVAGLWEGMMRISSSYMNVFALILSIFLIPKLAPLKAKEALRIMVKMGGILIGIICFCLVSLFVLKDFFLPLILSKEFLPVREIMTPFLLGDILKFAGYIISIFFLSRGMIHITIISDLLFNGLFFILYNKMLIGWIGIQGSGYAYFLTFFSYFLFQVFMLSIYKNRNLKNG